MHFCFNYIRLLVRIICVTFFSFTAPLLFSVSIACVGLCFLKASISFRCPIETTVAPNRKRSVVHAGLCTGLCLSVYIKLHRQLRTSPSSNHSLSIAFVSYCNTIAFGHRPRFHHYSPLFTTISFFVRHRSGSTSFSDQHLLHLPLTSNSITFFTQH